MTPAETYEKMAKETGSQILGQLYRERAAALRNEQGKEDTDRMRSAPRREETHDTDG